MKKLLRLLPLALCLLPVSLSAQTKDSALPTAASVAATDRVRMLMDPAGTPASKTATVTVLATAMQSLTNTLTNKSIDLGSNTLTFTSAQLRTACSDETGTGALVFGTSPNFTTGITIGSVAVPTISSSNTLTNKTMLSTANTFTGTTTNDSAASGVLGEYAHSEVATGSAVSLTTATGADVTSISLTAGDWDVEGNINISATSATITATSGGISTSSATLPTDGSEVANGLQATTTSLVNGITLPRKRISIASTTTVYLVIKSTFSAGSQAAYGSITARRIR